jgi:hypothetical protein
MQGQKKERLIFNGAECGHSTNAVPISVCWVSRATESELSRRFPSAESEKEKRPNATREEKSSLRSDREEPEFPVHPFARRPSPEVPENAGFRAPAGPVTFSREVNKNPTQGGDMR